MPHSRPHSRNHVPCFFALFMQDIWSLGGAVLEMATGKPPWQSLNLRTPVALINWVKRTKGPPPLPENLSNPLTQFLVRCFERDPNKRASAKELLSDPFVANRHRTVLKSSSSKADSVSDIENLSRSAAIARIRRASCSDCSRPSSVGSSYTSNGTNPQSPRAHQGGGDAALTAVAQQVVKTMNVPSAEAQNASGDRSSLPQATRVRPTEVVTAGLEPTSSPGVTTPPNRRLVTGRSGSTSPNPFGGRRRSFENSPDTSRNPRSRVSIGAKRPSSNVHQESSHASDNTGSKADNEEADGSRVGEDRGASGEGGGREEGGTVTPDKLETTSYVTKVAIVVDTQGLVSKKGSDTSPASDCIVSSNLNACGTPGKGDSYLPFVVAPASENVPSVVAAETRSEDEEQARLKSKKSGRGGRPAGGVEGMASDVAAASWRWNQQ